MASILVIAMVIINLVMLGRVVVWAACPIAVNDLTMIVPSTIKFQVGSTYDLRSQISLASFEQLMRKTTS